ncbi:unnamed protein product [Phytophthora fragariaefolia]|uniref:Unnamed protein product n=1 Tax=Phytophthora fragariaefolia TaxID=1490495 RepID=A0A9W6Y9V4_9STRA|nr:unnamed protein product [Phytophthora fragariaefolia]
MVACRYSRAVESEEREIEEGGSHYPMIEQLVTEEGGDRDAVPGRLAPEEGVAVEEQRIPEEGEAASDAIAPTVTATSVTMALSGRAVPDRAVLAQVRITRKTKERDAKKQHVERAVRRSTASQYGVTEIELAVAQMNGERCERSQQQADDARNELKEIRERWRIEQSAQDRPTVQRAHVSLVQRRMKFATKVTRGLGVEADDGLPTTIMEIDEGKHAVNWDSCARHTVAGTDWMRRGERVAGPAPVDYIESVGGFLLDVTGVWAFEVYNIFGQSVSVTACIIEGCTDEFLIGVDFLKKHKTNMDFNQSEVRYFEKDLRVVIPFRTEGSDNDKTRIAPVRMTQQAKLVRRVVTPVWVAVVAPDGEQGVFVPTHNSGAVMLVTTVTSQQWKGVDPGH